MIEIKKEKIIELKADAECFRNAFYIIFEQTFERNTGTSPCISAICTNGCFAIELYLKLLRVIDTYDNQACSGGYMKGHKLNELLTDLNTTYQQELETKFSNSKYVNQNVTLNQYLKNIGDYFERWRYSFESTNLDLNLNIISDLLNILGNYVNKKYKSIDTNVAKHIKNKDFKNSVFIENSKNIKKKDYEAEIDDSLVVDDEFGSKSD